MATGNPELCKDETDHQAVFACNNTVCPNPVECYNRFPNSFAFPSGQRPTSGRRGRPSPVNSKGGGSFHTGRRSPEE